MAAVAMLTTAMQRQNICIAFIKRRSNVEAVGPAMLYNILCLLGVLLCRAGALG